ncbi:MAG: GNAT family N-acetyltransferase [Chloroflexota bacterium]
MTITLVPMKEADFAWYRENLAVAYAQEQVESGQWDAATALDQARASIVRDLPQGIATLDNSLYLVLAEGNPDPVGQLWFMIRPGIAPSAFIMDIEIYAPYQRKGYAQQALQALEALLKPLGISKIGLHVHVQNRGAQALYEKMGYSVTGLRMIKKLDADE